MRIPLLLSLPFALAGCASKMPPADPTNQAVKMRYWAIQDANRERIPLKIPVRVPGCVEAGALRVPSIEVLEFPR